MRVLLSTIGSRGDVQPMVGLALQLRAMGHAAQICAPPDFQAWVEGFGLPMTPIGPELRSTAKPGSKLDRPTPQQQRQLLDETVTTQFATITQAAEGCDLIVGATALQIAAPSVAEKMGVPYVFAAYCPAVLPSPHHAPLVFVPQPDATPAQPTEYPGLWARDGERFNMLFGAALNVHRDRLGLAPVEDVRSHVFTKRPWLAADGALAPWPDPQDTSVLQTGAWLVEDDRPLASDLEAFLDTGEPPIYFGFGSVRAPEGISAAMIGAARALGRRAIVLRGWADLSLVDEASDCISIGEVNQQALFRRVAAIVHHGGAGTTSAAALSGAPQVVTPQHYDQPYWAQRVQTLGIGVAQRSCAPTRASLTEALERALQPDMAAGAQSLAKRVRRDGARFAAEQLVAAA
jgi:vancomycin aglycone glucosyltransferase